MRQHHESHAQGKNWLWLKKCFILLKENNSRAVHIFLLHFERWKASGSGSRLIWWSWQYQNYTHRWLHTFLITQLRSHPSCANGNYLSNSLRKIFLNSFSSTHLHPTSPENAYLAYRLSSLSPWSPFLTTSDVSRINSSSWALEVAHKTIFQFLVWFELFLLHRSLTWQWQQRV